MEGIMGPIASDPNFYMQEFKYKDVTRYNSRGEVVQGCHAKMCTEVCKHINKITDIDGAERNYFCVFIPVYNESAEQLMKTVLSVMENIDFMKHEVKYHGDKIGTMLKKESSELEVVIVPVFDGMYEHQMSPSVRDWLSGDFPNILVNMPDGEGSENVRDLMTEEERREDIEVRVANQRWWYYCLTNSDAEIKNTKEMDPEDIGRLSDSTLLKFVHGARQDSIPNSYLHFHMVPIIKRTNHRKHNSLHWFIEGICCGLDTNLIMLTECSTTFQTSCIAHLTYEMLTRRSEIIACCGQMRVEKPSRTFHPCKHTKIPFFKHSGEHDKQGTLPCWKCYAAYYCSCAPMQAFETELLQLLNMPVFNIVEAIPVLYGPCTLMNWPKVKNLKVIEEYFDMMFSNTTLDFGAVRARRRQLPGVYLESEYSLLHPFDETNDGGGADETVYSIGGGKAPMHHHIPTPSEVDGNRETNMDMGYADVYASHNDSTVSYLNEALHGDDIEVGAKSLSATKKHKMKIGTTASAPISANNAKYYELPLVEILMAQLRLAEDRILSFVTVFCTGFGTKMVNSSIFYYEPEVTFDMILKQRRRWLNGMVMGFVFLFFSDRAALHTEGGFLDTHKAFKSIKLVNALWALNILQGVLSFFSPSMLMVALYKSLMLFLDPKYAIFYYSDFFQFNTPALYTGTLMFFYVLWALHVYHRHPSELYSTMMFFASAAASLTITFALFRSQVDQGGDDISGSFLVFLFAFFAPLGFAITQSIEVAWVYIVNAPWFFFYVGFYMMFIPSYSFARLWDTRWGNRYTKGDRSLGTVRQDLLKRRVWWFNVSIVLVNVIITVFCCLDRKNYAVPVFTACIVLPVLLQFSGGVLYMFIVAPLKSLCGSRKDKDENYNALFEERFNTRVVQKSKRQSTGEVPVKGSGAAVGGSKTFIRRANSLESKKSAVAQATEEVIYEEEIDSDEEEELQRQIQKSINSTSTSSTSSNRPFMSTSNFGKAERVNSTQGKGRKGGLPGM